MLRRAFTVALPTTLLVLISGSAWASCTDQNDWSDVGSGSAGIGSGSSLQSGSWSDRYPDENVGLRTAPASSMSTAYCQDSFVDWGVYPRTHYDSRRVRSCKPGTPERTDPGGDGNWEEDQLFCDPITVYCTHVKGMKMGAGVAVTDNLDYQADQDFPDTHDCQYTATVDIPSINSMYVEIRTRYQNGSVKYNDGGRPFSASS